VEVWILSGVALTRALPHHNPVQAGLNGSATLSTWCFLSLFLFPSLNRIWMKQADRFLARLVSVTEVRDLLSKIATLNATDISMGSVKTAVFHPIPTLQDRIASLDRSP
jgi:Zn-dependent protease with chaperone function